MNINHMIWFISLICKYCTSEISGDVPDRSSRENHVWKSIFKNIIKKVNQVDWFYIVQNLTYVPFGLLTIYFVDFIGLKKSVWICTTFNAIGSGVRLGWVTIRCTPMLLNESPKMTSSTRGCKVGCIFSAIVACILPHTAFVPDDHLEDAPHFSIKTAYFQA